MTDEKILRRTLETAYHNDRSFDVYKWFGAAIPDIQDWDVGEGTIYGIIFSHDFAKAFWGTMCSCCSNVLEPHEPSFSPTCKPAWQYHLQLMVLEDDPLRYIERFL